MKGERKFVLKKNMFCLQNTLLLVEIYISMLLKKLGFSTPHKVWFFVFGMLNAKNLAFSTLDANALLLFLRSLNPLLHNILSPLFINR